MVGRHGPLGDYVPHNVMAPKHEREYAVVVQVTALVMITKEERASVLELNVAMKKSRKRRKRKKKMMDSQEN